MDALHWQPMNTAPRDGKAILAAFRNHAGMNDVGVFCYDTRFNPPRWRNTQIPVLTVFGEDNMQGWIMIPLPQIPR